MACNLLHTKECTRPRIAAHPLVLRACALLRFVSYIACIVAVECAASYAYVLAPAWGLDGVIAYEYAGAVAAFVGCVMLGLHHILHKRPHDMAFSHKVYAPALYLSCALSLFELSSFVCAGEELSQEAALQSLRVLVLCLGVGFFEELLFRGIIFQGLLRAFKHRSYAFGVAAFLCSLIFGIAHIDVLSINVMDPLQCAQAIGKIAQAGLNSYLFCAIVYCTGSVRSPSLLHAACDFILMLPSVGLFGYDDQAIYVVEGPEGVSTLILYVILSCILLVCCVRAKRLMKSYPARTHTAC